MKPAILLLPALILSACASHPPAGVPLPAQDVEISSPHVARIYVLDARELAQGLHRVAVEADDRPIGELTDGTYLCWEREPGACLIEMTFEDVGTASNEKMVDTVDASLEPGEVYYYGLTLDPVWKRPKVHVLERDEARALLAKLKPAQR
jgi:hypothetical protein